MSGEKTEKPTAKRRQKAREDGQIAKSTDLNSAFMLGGAATLLLFAGNYGVSIFKSQLVQMLGSPYESAYSRQELLGLIQDIAWSLMLIAGPLFAALMVIAISVNMMQVKPLLTFKPLQPKLEKINPLSGVKRIFSQRSVIEALKAILKMCIVGAIGYAVISANLDDIMQFGHGGLNTLTGSILSIMTQLIFWCFSAYLVMGFADWRYQAYNQEKQMRMSIQDIKDEQKSTEGDQQTKGKSRQLGRAMIQKQQISEVPTADVVVINPTHYSVAIRYDPDIAPAPHVVAKGVDHFALKIREIAKEHDIQLVENVPLARTLYSQVDVNDMVPPDLYLAVAEVLAFVFQKKGGR